MIYVVDGITGIGKSSYAIRDIIQKIKNGEKIIYVTPYLREIDRIKNECKKCGIELFEPNTRQGRGRKSKHLKILLGSGKNIVTTHACFDSISKDFLNTLVELNYTMYMDEVHEVVEQYYLSDDDLTLLRNKNWISINPDNKKVTWNEITYSGKFNDFKNLCEIGSIYYIADKMYMWTFPTSVFSIMKDIYILTYLFKGQNQAYYYDMNNVDYKMCTLINKTPELSGMDASYEIIDYSIDKYKEDINKIFDKINIYEGSLNYEFNLSSYWFENAENNQIKELKNNIYNYFFNITKSKSEYNMWTTLKSYKDKLKGNGYTKGFIEINARATNEYAHKTTLAYGYDRFMNPVIKNFFLSHGVQVNEEIYSASEMIQWVFRSAVRKGEDINLYIPSKRARNIFIKWLNCEIIQQPIPLN